MSQPKRDEFVPCTNIYTGNLNDCCTLPFGHDGYCDRRTIPEIAARNRKYWGWPTVEEAAAHGVRSKETSREA